MHYFETIDLEVYALNKQPDTIVTSTGSIFICPKTNTLIEQVGGILGGGSQWYWYEDGCSGNIMIDSGGTIEYLMTEPVVTLYCTAEGGCNEVCQSITLYMETDPAKCLQLPINLVNFSGQHMGEHEGLLTWHVREDEKNTTYILEKSENGQSFKTVYETKASQNNAFKSYSYIDDLTFEINYYRLRINDVNGGVTYSNIVELSRNGENSEINFYPNPTNGYLKMTHNLSNKYQLISIIVYDVFSKEIFQTKLTDGESFELKAPDGFYILEARGSGGIVRIEKIVKISR
jgi:hypothetical protein